MSDKILPSKKIFSIKDARELSKKRLPKLVFDFIDGASGEQEVLEMSDLEKAKKLLEPMASQPCILR